MFWGNGTSLTAALRALDAGSAQGWPITKDGRRYIIMTEANFRHLLRLADVEITKEA